MAFETFEEFMERIGITAIPFSHQNHLAYCIDGENFLYEDIPKSQYAWLLRKYHFQNNPSRKRDR